MIKLALNVIKYSKQMSFWWNEPVVVIKCVVQRKCGLNKHNEPRLKWFNINLISPSLQTRRAGLDNVMNKTFYWIMGNVGSCPSGVWPGLPDSWQQTNKSFGLKTDNGDFQTSTKTQKKIFFIKYSPVLTRLGCSLREGAKLLGKLNNCIFGQVSGALANH